MDIEAIMRMIERDGGRIQNATKEHLRKSYGTHPRILQKSSSDISKIRPQPKVEKPISNTPQDRSSRVSSTLVEYIRLCRVTNMESFCTKYKEVTGIEILFDTYRENDQIIIEARTRQFAGVGVHKIHRKAKFISLVKLLGNIDQFFLVLWINHNIRYFRDLLLKP